MNKLLGKTKNNLSNKIFNSVKPITNSHLILNRNYYSEKWNEEQEILKMKNKQLQKLVSLKLSEKESFIYEEIKKNNEQNVKILSLLKKQNEDIENIKKKY